MDQLGPVSSAMIDPLDLARGQGNRDIAPGTRPAAARTPARWGFPARPAASSARGGGTRTTRWHHGAAA